MKTYQQIAKLEQSRRNALDNKNPKWAETWADAIKLIVDTAPSGSGFNNGTKLESATNTTMVFTTAFHHMDDNGSYCGWTYHKVKVTAEFGGFDIKVTGENKRDIKEYIGEVFRTWLNGEVGWMGF